MSDDRAEIAKAVASALGLRPTGGYYWSSIASTSKTGHVILAGDQLAHDGSNVFCPHWQVLCRDWLLERGHLQMENSKFTPNWGAFTSIEGVQVVHCYPPEEWCARAIAELMKGKI
jgi:hypothetical protein